MNKVILMGRLTRDPEVRYSQGENSMAIARYTLAVDRRRGGNQQDGQTADFIGIVAFGRSGEFAEKYLKKGTKVVVTGRIQTGSYTNKDGVKVYTTDVVAEDQEFAESKGSSAGNGGNSYGSDFGGNSPAPSAAGDGFMNIPDGIDEELPFN
ncbi:MAG: single-stranded DNA-binding protein [Butyrivibrio sp.]|nr:single-stranded DNA-binding protein [Butyrivibrio sp.]